MATPRIALVSPSGYPAEEWSIANGIAALEQCGCSVDNLFSPSQRYQRFAADDASRLAQLHHAAQLSDVDVVMALRGGYGLSRILHQIDWEMLASSGKRFVGHSDFTALQMGLLAHGVGSFAGPMLCPDFARPDPSAYAHNAFWSCLNSQSHTIHFESHPHEKISVDGILWGGNLTMLAHLVGTPYLPKIAQGILFIEDINEHPYRVERMLLQLLHAGYLNQRAIVLGDFSGYRLAEHDHGYDFKAMCDFLANLAKVPVVTGLPFGHVRDKNTLAVGSVARLESDGLQCSLHMHSYPRLT